MSGASIAGYRRLLRACTNLFGQDVVNKKGAFLKVREQFELNRQVTDPHKLEQLHKDIYDVEDFLKTNLIQGTLNHRGNYEVDLSEERVGALDKDWELEHLTPDTKPKGPETCCGGH